MKTTKTKFCTRLISIRYIISALALVTLLISCSEKKRNNDFSISGNITNLNEGDQLFLDYLTPSKIITKDTAFIDSDGNYSFNQKIEKLGYYRLRINNQNFINLVLESGTKAVIKGDGNNLMDTYTINGSNESSRLKQFNWAYRTNELKQDSINQVYKANPNNQNLFAQLQVAKFTAIEQMKTTFKQLIDEKPASLVSLAIVQQLDQKNESDRYKKVDQGLANIIPNDLWYIGFHKKVKNFVRLYVGEAAPEFTLTNTEGKPTSLSSLKGKVVLIDFWASWCRPCRAENPNVVKAYNKYNKKGFEVLSVSLDGMPQQNNAKQDWLNAIEKDGLIWKNHVSDLKGWNSSVVKQYNIEGIPYTLLIDKEGLVLGMNLRGRELEEKLATIF